MAGADNGGPTGCRRRPQLSLYARERIQNLLDQGLSCADVVTTVKLEGISTCCQTVWRLKQHTQERGTIRPLPKSGRPTKLISAVLRSIDDAMSQDGETTAKELVATLHQAGVFTSLSTALKGRRLLGWTHRGTAYCQLIRAPNRVKRLHWAQENLGADFHDVIWTDETSLQIETHRRFCCRKRGQKPRYKPRPNTQLKYTCGLALVGVELQKLASSMELWTLNITVKFWMIIWYLSFNLCIRITTDSCRIMIPNIHLGVLKNGLQEKG